MRGDLTTSLHGRGMRRRFGGWRKAGVAIAGAFFFVAVSFAGPQTLQAEEKPLAVVKAERLMDLFGAESTIEQMIVPMIDQITGIIIQANPSDGPVIRELMNDYFLPEFKNRLPEYMELSARLYAEHFNEAELDELIAFYETPLGQKMIAKFPVLTQESMQLGGLWGQQVAMDAYNKLLPKLKKRGLQEPRI